MKDPRNLYYKPPFKTPSLPFPGLESQVDPAPIYGKDAYRGNGRLRDRVALITGGDSGIGRAVAYTFACQGAKVAISYLPEEETDAQVVKQEIEAIGGKVLLLPGDIQQESVCQGLVKETVAGLGGLDILINNAAYQQAFDSLTDVTEKALDQTFRTNVYAMLYLAKVAWEIMPPGSSIINTTSIQAYSPSSVILPYAASKAAIVNITKSLAKMAISKGIRVNAVAPGPIWTPLNPMSMPSDYVASFGEQTPYQRPGQPIEVANVFVFLASDEASYVTGHVYGVTGGEEMPV